MPKQSGSVHKTFEKGESEADLGLLWACRKVHIMAGGNAASFCAASLDVRRAAGVQTAISEYAWEPLSLFSCVSRHSAYLCKEHAIHRSSNIMEFGFGSASVSVSVGVRLKSPLLGLIVI